MIAQLVLGFSLLVAVHEAGHFFFAKLFGIRVKKFYIFFDFLFPLPSVGKFALLKKSWRGTEYGLGWFPLGGYVQIHGMVDETQGPGELASEPEPDEFRAKPAWQRLLVMAGGVLVNVAVGLLIFMVMAYSHGQQYLPADLAQPDGVRVSQLGRSVGLLDGDRVVGLNGKPLADFDQLYNPELLATSGTYFTVERNGARFDLPVLPASFFGALAAADTAYITAPHPFIIASVVAGGGAEAAGLSSGDRIRALNGQRIRYFEDLNAPLAAAAGKPVSLLVQGPDGSRRSVRVVVNAEGKLGFRAKFELPTRTRTFTPAQSVGAGASQAASVLRLQGLGLAKIITGHVAVSSSLAGPVEIAQQFGGQWDWPHFWQLVGTLSLVLAFMNLLPIPALDGGHIVFLLYEMVAGRPVSTRVMAQAQSVGTMLLMSLMLYVLVIKQLLKLF